jgi:hypothetical protein
MILIVSTPFFGHLNVLCDAAKILQDCLFLIVCWPNNRLTQQQRQDIERITQYEPIEIVDKTPMSCCDPNVWCNEHYSNTIDSCVAIYSKLPKIDAILYDVFAWQGNYLGKKFGIRNVCSVAAFHGSIRPSDNINQYYISDGSFVAGDGNIIWSYETLEVEKLKLPMNTLFYGYNSMDISSSSSSSSSPSPLSSSSPSSPSSPSPLPSNRTIIISFGTVVMGYLWDKNESVRIFVTNFFDTLVSVLEEYQHSHTIYLSSHQDPQQYPHWLHVEKHLPQRKLLQNCDLFITHGGNNSFHEALLCGVPMLVVPFFGDQHDVSECVVHHNLGLTIPLKTLDKNSTNGNKYREIPSNLRQQIKYLINQKPQITHKCEQLTLQKSSPTALRFYVLNQIPVMNGDLLYGTNVDRESYITSRGIQTQIPFGLFKPWCEIKGSQLLYPPLIDIYHDSILNILHYTKDLSQLHPQMKQRLIQYHNFIRSTLPTLDFSTPRQSDKSFVILCCKGIDFQLGYTQNNIHFVISTYDRDLNWVTHKEFLHLWKFYRHEIGKRIFFYKVTNDHIVLTNDIVSYL